MGRKDQYIFSAKEDAYIRANYLIKTRKYIADYLKVNYQVVKRRYRQLGLVVPQESLNTFKGLHNKKEAYPKPVKKSQTSNRNGKVERPESEVKFKTKVIDYSKFEMYKVDNKTWKYRPKTQA